MDTAKYAYQALLFISENRGNSTVINQALAVLARLANIGGNPTAVESNELINAIGGVKQVPANAGVPHKVAPVVATPVVKPAAAPEETWDEAATKAAAQQGIAKKTV